MHLLKSSYSMIIEKSNPILPFVCPNKLAWPDKGNSSSEISVWRLWKPSKLVKNFIKLTLEHQAIKTAISRLQGVKAQS